MDSFIKLMNSFSALFGSDKICPEHYEFPEFFICIPSGYTLVYNGYRFKGPCKFVMSAIKRIDEETYAFRAYSTSSDFAPSILAHVSVFRAFELSEKNNGVGVSIEEILKDVAHDAVLARG